MQITMFDSMVEWQIRSDFKQCVISVIILTDQNPDISPDWNCW